MSLEVIRRPEIVEYSTGFEARWKCAWLPILWKFQSDLFPTNSVDVALTITSVADNGEGLAEFTTAANHLLSRFDWVNVTSSTVTGYEGINQLVEVTAANRFTLNIPFSATATGSAIKYYNNYHALIEVYGGLPSGHEFENQDPSLLTTTVKIFFDANNIAVVDLSRIAQTLINNIFDRNIPSWPNVLNFWDQTEILLKESFDQSTGVVVTTLERYGCIKDGGFVTGADWSNEFTGATWTFGSDQANVSLDQAGDADSKELTQTILGDALARFSITVTSTFTHTSGTPTVKLQALIGGTLINVQGSTTSQLTLTNTVIGLTTDALGVFSLEAVITAGSGTDTVDVVIDDVEVCIGVANKVVNSKLAFRNGRGGNMFDYIARSIVTKAKWMTGFEQPSLFSGEYFSLSIIIEDFSTIDPKLAIEQRDNAGVQVADDIIADIDDQDQGVYQLRIDALGISASTKLLKAIIVDGNLFGTAGWEAMANVGAVDLGEIIVISEDIICVILGTLLRRTSDGGLIWATVADNGAGGTFISMDYDDANDISVAVSVNKDVYVSVNFGATWLKKTDITTTGVNKITVAGGVIFGSGGSGTVSKSSNQGTSWTAVNVTTPRNLTAIFALTNQDVWVGSSGSGDQLHRTSNGGSSWAAQTPGSGTAAFNDIYFFDISNGIAVRNVGAVEQTSDGGTTWNTRVSGIAVNINGVWMQSASVAYFSANGGNLRKSTDGGVTWADEPDALGAIDLNDIHGESKPDGQTIAASADAGESEKNDSLISFDESKAITETICIDHNQKCSNQEIILNWLNNFGGWDTWKFFAEKDFNVDISESQRTVKNIYDNWPLSYDKETLGEEALIKAKKSTLVRSQFLTQQQVEAIAGIKTSMSVLQIIDGVDNKVTVLVDKNSFRIFTESDNLHSIQFIIQATDDIPTQSN